MIRHQKKFGAFVRYVPIPPKNVAKLPDYFGMGIDCAGVREVVHVGAPDDVESYIQESGWA